MVVQMISVERRQVPGFDALVKLLLFNDDESMLAGGNMTALLEPVMMVFLGGVVGGRLSRWYLPIFKLASVVG